MNAFRIIFMKELTDTIRDRRTLVFMILIPLLLFPVLIGVVTRIQVSQMKKAEGKTLRVGLIANGSALGFRELLATAPGYRVVEDFPADSTEAWLGGERLDAVVTFPRDFDAQVAGLHAGTLQLFFKSSEDFDVAKRRLNTLVSQFERKLIRERFARLNLDQEIVEVIRVEEHDVASLKEKLGKTIGGFIPYLFVLFCFMGSMYPAIDLAAGEKERGTIETLLTAPMSRFQILMGKFAVVVMAGLLSAVVSMLGLYAGVRLATQIPQEILRAVLGILDVQSVLLVLSLLFPLTVLFAALLLSLSFFARSYKEAQTLISPLTIVMIVPVAIGMLPGVVLDAVTALIPVLNVSLATKEIIAGTITPGLLVEVYLSLFALAAVSLWGCTWWFEREETIFRGS